MPETRKGDVSHNPTIPCHTACQKEKVCAAFLTETSPKLYVYELVIHKLAAVGWQSPRWAKPGFAFSNERLTRKTLLVNWRVEKPCPLKRQHAVGCCCALSLGNILRNPVGARSCCLLQIPWPQAPDPAVCHSNPAGTPAANFWPSWPGRTIGRREW